MGARVALLSESVDKDIRGRVMSIAPLFALAGMSGGSASLGFISARINVKLSLIIAFISAFIGVFLCSILSEVGKGKKEGNEKSPNYLYSLSSLKASLLSKELKPFAVMMIMGGLITGVCNVFLPGYLSLIGLGKGIIGLVFSLSMLSQAIGQPISGLFIDTFGEKKGFLLNAVIGNTVFMAIFLILSEVAPIASPIPLIFASFLAAFSNTAFFTYIARNTDESKRGSVYGSMNSFVMFSLIPAPIIGAALWGVMPKMAFIYCLILGMAEVPLILRLKG